MASSSVGGEIGSRHVIPPFLVGLLRQAGSEQFRPWHVSSGELGREKLAGEDGLHGGKQRGALVAQGRQIASQHSERAGAGVAAEAAGDLLLDLERAQIALSLVVVEGNRQVIEEGQDRLMPQDQPLQKIARRGLFQSSSLTRTALRRRIGGQASSQERRIACAQSVAFSVGQRGGASTRLVNELLHLQQERF